MRFPKLVNLTLEDKRKLMHSISADIEFLSKHNIIDYSLLLSIEDCKPSTNFTTQKTESEHEEKLFAELMNETETQNVDL